MARRRCWRLKELRFLVMPASMLELELGTTMGFPSISTVRRKQGVETDNCRAEALNDPVGKLLCRKSQVASGEEGMPLDELQESLWQDFFAHASMWWDNRRRKLTIRSPDFRHKISKVPLWLNSRHKPAWVDSQLAAWDAGMTEPPQSLSSSIEGQRGMERFGGHEGPPDIGMWRRLCEDGTISDAVDALNSMVQEGSQVGNNPFYRILKRCIAQKDLVMGRQIHALAIESGYEGDSFLATHLIGLYASHGLLEEAMQVFRKVCAPTTYNWATIIFAYARREEAPQAIRLYREMLKATTIKPDNRLYVAVLQACATAEDLAAGREVHAHILASPDKPDNFVEAGLVGMYAKCGNLRDARQVFDKLPHKNVVAWTVMLGAYAQHGMGQEALSLYSRMQDSSTIPDSVTFLCLLQACANVGAGALDQGRQIHGEIKEQELEEDVIVGGSLVNMYAKCGSIEDARRVFDRLPERNVVAWTAMLAGYTHQGMGQLALSLYCTMQQEGVTPPNTVTFVCLLQACASVGVGALEQGKHLHTAIEEQGLQVDVVLGASLVNMYAKCGSLGDARRLFDRLPERDVIAWNAMLAGYAQQGRVQDALSLYSSMQQDGTMRPNTVTFVCLLQACASIGVEALDQGKLIHAQIKYHGLEEDVVVGGTLVNMYAKCGSLEDARLVFDRLPARNVVAWTAMLAGYAQQGMGQDALNLYSTMQQEGITAPDSVTFVCLLQACATVGLGALDKGKLLHAQVKEQGLEQDVVVGGSLVNMYAKCGSVGHARWVFDRLHDRNVVAWTAMLAGYAQEDGQKALDFHNRMEEEGVTAPDSQTFVCLLQACASVGIGALEKGKQLHAQIEAQRVQEDVVLGASLVNMYAKCGSLRDARSVFDKLPDRNVVAWTAMLAGYAQQGMGEEALNLHSRMKREGIITPDSVTFLCLLQACACVAALPLGKQLHAEIEDKGLQADVGVGGGLVNMYAKCGSMFDSQEVFDSLPAKSIEAWNALTSGYARQGDSEMVFDLVNKMRLEGIKPDGITFLSVLTVCSHAGNVDKGQRYFKAMLDYGISPMIEHYTCMVDLLGRAGHLDEALQIAKNIPFLPDSAVWLTLLGACQKWKNVEIGEQAFQYAVNLDGKNSSSYVLMSNIYASTEMWEEAEEMQARRKNLGAWKKPGQSWWTDTGGVVHTFVVGDKKHPESEGIYARLERLVPEMKKAGYVPHLHSLRDLSDDE